MAKFNTRDLELFSRDIDNLIRELPKEVIGIVSEATSDMESAVRRKYQEVTKEKTGNLLKGISSDVRQTAADRVVGLVKSEAPHVVLVEFGTQEERKPRSKKVLYDKDTDTFFGKEVAPMPELAPLRKAFDENERRISQKAGDKLLQLIEKRLMGR